MDNIIHEAITKKLCLGIHCGGFDRVVEPHTYDVSKAGNPVMIHIPIIRKVRSEDYSYWIRVGDSSYHLGNVPIPEATAAVEKVIARAAAVAAYSLVFHLKQSMPDLLDIRPEWVEVDDGV